MLEQLSLSVSTAIFLFCTMLVGSILPKSTPDKQLSPLPDTAAIVVQGEITPSIVGKWNSAGKIFEFTDTGNFKFGSLNGKYTVADNSVTVDLKIGGENRKYTLPLEVISPRVISLNGIRMYLVG